MSLDVSHSSDGEREIAPLVSEEELREALERSEKVRWRVALKHFRDAGKGDLLDRIESLLLVALRSEVREDRRAAAVSILQAATSATAALYEILEKESGLLAELGRDAAIAPVLIERGKGKPGSDLGGKTADLIGRMGFGISHDPPSGHKPKSRNAGSREANLRGRALFRLIQSIRNNNPCPDIEPGIPGRRRGVVSLKAARSALDNPKIALHWVAASLEAGETSSCRVWWEVAKAFLDAHSANRDSRQRSGAGRPRDRDRRLKAWAQEQALVGNQKAARVLRDAIHSGFRSAAPRSWGW